MNVPSHDQDKHCATAIIVCCYLNIYLFTKKKTTVKVQ